MGAGRRVRQVPRSPKLRLPHRRQPRPRRHPPARVNMRSSPKSRCCRSSSIAGARWRASVTTMSSRRTNCRARCSSRTIRCSRASTSVVPVNELTIDEPAMREMAGPDFPPGVPQSARDGTRKNMLSEALLDGEKYPTIRLARHRRRRRGRGLRRRRGDHDQGSGAQRARAGRRWNARTARWSRAANFRSSSRSWGSSRSASPWARWWCSTKCASTSKSSPEWGQPPFR